MELTPELKALLEKKALGHVITMNKNRVIVFVQDPEDPMLFAVLEGKANVADDSSLQHINAVARKFTGGDYANLQPGEQRISVDIDLERVTGRGPWVE